MQRTLFAALLLLALGAQASTCPAVQVSWDFSKCAGTC
jgi:hypothetical protein